MNDTFMEQSIQMEVDPEKVIHLHRGDIAYIEIGYDDKKENYKVRLLSKYRLRSGMSRVKLVTIREENTR